MKDLGGETGAQIASDVKGMWKGYGNSVNNVFNKGSGCYVAGTAILNFGGYRPIETIEVGDQVTTASGSAKLVGK